MNCWRHLSVQKYVDCHFFTIFYIFCASTVYKAVVNCWRHLSVQKYVECHFFTIFFMFLRKTLSKKSNLIILFSLLSMVWRQLIYHLTSTSPTAMIWPILSSIISVTRLYSTNPSWVNQSGSKVGIIFK